MTRVSWSLLGPRWTAADHLPNVSYITAAPVRQWPGHGDASCQHPVPGGRTLACVFLIEWAGLQLPESANRKHADKCPAICVKSTLKPEQREKKSSKQKINKWTKKSNTTQTSNQTNQKPTNINQNRKKTGASAFFSLLERGICYSLQREWCFDPRQALMPVILIQNANICFIHSGLTPWGKRGAKKQGRRSPQDDCFS